MEIDQIYPLPQAQDNINIYKDSNYGHLNSPIYQNTSKNSVLTHTNQSSTPIYSNTNIERYRSQGMLYGESLAHHLRHSLRSENSQGKL